MSISTKKVIIHIDGDAFFASCEIAQDERLRGKPVVVGREKGIATAVSYEAKALGIGRGMQIWEIKKLYPNVIITSSQYHTYATYSRRMYEIVRRYTPYVEEYSVDECFADISHIKLDNTAFKSHYDLIKALQGELERDLGMTFSIGCAPTKVLAKIASKWSKPAGLTVITTQDIRAFLDAMPIGKIWGIGPSTSLHLSKLGLKNAFELSLKPEWWIKENLSKPLIEIWHELKGESVLNVHTNTHHEYKSIMKTRTFSPSSTDKEYIFSELCKNLESACTRLRKYNLKAKYLRFFIKTQEFRYHSAEFILDTALNTPLELIALIKKEFNKIFKKNTHYRATGIIFGSLSSASSYQYDLFGNTDHVQKNQALFATVDSIVAKYGNRALFLAQTFKARKKENTSLSEDMREFLKLGIPYWGEAI